jgi:hypothetical protein
VQQKASTREVIRCIKRLAAIEKKKNTLWSAGKITCNFEIPVAKRIHDDFVDALRREPQGGLPTRADRGRPLERPTPKIHLSSLGTRPTATPTLIDL